VTGAPHAIADLVAATLCALCVLASCLQPAPVTLARDDLRRELIDTELSKLDDAYGLATTATRATPPAPDHSITVDEFRSRALDAPRMARWFPHVWQTVNNDPRDFALLMSLIYTESGGEQFAISRSGCSGLLQFCARTAARAPFNNHFEFARLRICNCADRRCRVPRAVRRFLETTPPALHPIVSAELPCDLGDPRFDARAAIRAGWAYVDCLSRRFDGNIYLIYIGYNSGPGVAQRIWRRLGPERASHLRQIRRVLRRALAPGFGWRRARRRARSLVRVHLPKIARIYRRYRDIADDLVEARRPPYVAAPRRCTYPY
jgi:hypothetical protein